MSHNDVQAVSHAFCFIFLCLKTRLYHLSSLSQELCNFCMLHADYFSVADTNTLNNHFHSYPLPLSCCCKWPDEPELGSEH